MEHTIAWINGALVPWQEAAIPVWDLGVVAGASISEMARTFHRTPFRIDRHLNRFLSSCDALQFPLEWQAESLAEAVQAVVSHNAASMTNQDELGIVLFSTAGLNTTYLGTEFTSQFRSHTVVHTFRLDFGLWRESLLHGVRLRIPARRQLPEHDFPVHHKTRNRLHWWLADREAHATEPGSRALLLEQSGRVTETSTSSFYAVIDQQIITPQGAVLQSLSREVVQELARAAGIPFIMRPLLPDELQNASEMFLSSTPSCLLPVGRLNGTPLRYPAGGPVFDRIIEGWSQLAGLDIRGQIIG
ncbi:MAG: aminotransferase class IV [Planctomycetaceae bacterium]|nr:aminotransferase class IV [Planctomycetaceae bacterium]